MEHARKKYGVSERDASRVLRQSRGTQRDLPLHRSDEDALTRDIIALAGEYGLPLKHEDIEAATVEGAVQRLRPKLMTVTAVLASLIFILRETGIGSDVMKPIAAPIVGGMITSTIHLLILVPVFFALMKGRALKRGTLRIVDGRQIRIETRPRCDISDRQRCAPLHTDRPSVDREKTLFHYLQTDWRWTHSSPMKQLGVPLEHLWFQVLPDV